MTYATAPRAASTAAIAPPISSDEVPPLVLDFAGVTVNISHALVAGALLASPLYTATKPYVPGVLKVEGVEGT